MPRHRGAADLSHGAVFRVTPGLTIAVEYSDLSMTQPRLDYAATSAG